MTDGSSSMGLRVGSNSKSGGAAVSAETNGTIAVQLVLGANAGAEGRRSVLKPTSPGRRNGPIGTEDLSCGEGDCISWTEERFRENLKFDIDRR